MVNFAIASQIRSTILKTQGAAGPSGLDATYWRRLCTSFQKESEQLCDAIAKFTIFVSSSHIDPQCLSAFTASRLIANIFLLYAH